MRISLIFIFLFISLCLDAQYQKQKEVYYQDLFSKKIKGQKEVVLNDLARVDIVTDTFAIEVDFAPKWAESIGQSLYYGLMLNKKPGILLVVEGKKEERYVNRVTEIARVYGITVWIMNYQTNKYYRVKL